VYSEDELLPLSALQHLLFCERQCALIHVEQVWQENRLTAEGRLLHERVHEGSAESRGDVRIIRGLRLRSLQLGVVGLADVIEFVKMDERQGTTLPGAEGSWLPRPVEYKRGRPKPDECDKVQLCAQALSLEEMLKVPVMVGAIYYGLPRRRLRVEFPDSLRNTTREAARRLHEIIDAGVTPRPVYAKKCRQCSLSGFCLPSASAQGKKVQDYLDEVVK
jgi:CRISPR-associated exonuclease Cas4